MSRRPSPEEVICLDDDDDVDDTQAGTPPAEHQRQLPQRQAAVQSSFLANIDLSKYPPHILEQLAVGFLGVGGQLRTPPPSYEEAVNTGHAKPGGEVSHGSQARRDSGIWRRNTSSMENLSDISGHDRVEPRLPELRRSSLNSIQSQEEAAHRRELHEEVHARNASLQSGATNVRPGALPRLAAALRGTTSPIGGASLSDDNRMDTSAGVARPSQGALGVSGFKSFSNLRNSSTPPAPLLSAAHNSRPSSRDCAPPNRPSNSRPNSAEHRTPPATSLSQSQTSVFAQPKSDPKQSSSNVLNSSIMSSHSLGSDASSHETDPRPSTSHVSDRDSNRINAAKRDSVDGDQRLADAPEVNLPLSPSVLKTYKQSFADKRRLQHELAEMMGKNNTLTSEIDNLNFEYMTLKNKLILSQAEVGLKDSKVDDLETVLEQKENQLTSLNDELNKTIQELHHVQGVLDGQTDSEMPHGTPPINPFQVTEFLEELSEVKALNNRYKMDLTREHQKNSRLQRQIFEREKEIRRLENSQANKDTKIQSLEMQKLLMEDKVKHVKAAAAKQVELPAAPNERIKELEVQLKKAREDLETRTMHAKQCQLERNFMETVMTRGEATMKSLRQAVEAKNSELEKTQNENVELKNRLMEFEVRDVGTNASVEAVKQLELNLANEKLAKDTANTAFREVEKDNVKLRAELTATKARLTKITNKYTDITDSHQKGMADLVSMTSQMRASQTVLTPLKAEYEKLKEDFALVSDKLLAAENRCEIYYEAEEEMKATYETRIVERDAMIDRLKRQMVFYQKTAKSHRRLMQSTLNLLHVFEDICQGLATQGGDHNRMVHRVFQKLLRMASITEVEPPIGANEGSETETASYEDEEMPRPITEREDVTKVSSPGKRPEDSTTGEQPSPSKPSISNSPRTLQTTLLGTLGLCRAPPTCTTGTLSTADTSQNKTPNVGVSLGRDPRNVTFEEGMLQVITQALRGSPGQEQNIVGEVDSERCPGATSRLTDSLADVPSGGGVEGMTEQNDMRKEEMSGARLELGSLESETLQQQRQNIDKTSENDRTASVSQVSTGEAILDESNPIVDNRDTIAEHDSSYHSLIMDLPDLPEDDPLETKYLLQKAIREKQGELDALGCRVGVRLNPSGEVEMIVDEAKAIKSEVVDGVSIPSVQIKTEQIEVGGPLIAEESKETGALVAEKCGSSVQATLRGIYDILEKSHENQARSSRAAVLGDGAASRVGEPEPQVPHPEGGVETSTVETALGNQNTEQGRVAINEDRHHVPGPGGLNRRVSEELEPDISDDQSPAATRESERPVPDPNIQSKNMPQERKRQTDQVCAGSSLLINQRTLPNVAALVKESVQALNRSGKCSSSDEKNERDETIGTNEKRSGDVLSKIDEKDAAQSDSPISDSNFEHRSSAQERQQTTSSVNKQLSSAQQRKQMSSNVASFSTAASSILVGLTANVELNERSAMESEKSCGRSKQTEKPLIREHYEKFIAQQEQILEKEWRTSKAPGVANRGSVGISAGAEEQGNVAQGHHDTFADQKRDLTEIFERVAKKLLCLNLARQLACIRCACPSGAQLARVIEEFEKNVTESDEGATGNVNSAIQVLNMFGESPPDSGLEPETKALRRGMAFGALIKVHVKYIKDQFKDFKVAILELANRGKISRNVSSEQLDLAMSECLHDKIKTARQEFDQVCQDIANQGKRGSLGSSLTRRLAATQQGVENDIRRFLQVLQRILKEMPPSLLVVTPETSGLESLAKETDSVARDPVTEDDNDDILSYRLNESNEKVDIALHVSLVETDSEDEVEVIKTEKFSPRSERGPQKMIETVTISDSSSDAESIKAEFPPIESLGFGHLREVAGEEDFVAYEIKNMSSPVPEELERDFGSATQNPDDIPDSFDSQFEESGAEFGLRTPSPVMEEEREEAEEEEEYLFERGGEEDHYVPDDENVKMPRTSARSVGKYPRTAGRRLYQGLSMRGSKNEEAQKKLNFAQRLEHNLVGEQDFSHAMLCRYYMSNKYRDLMSTRGRKRGRPALAVSWAYQGSREQLDQNIGQDLPTELQQHLPHAFGINERRNHLHLNVPGVSHETRRGHDCNLPASPAKPAWTHFGGTPWSPGESHNVSSGQQTKPTNQPKKSVWAQSRESVRAQFTKGGLKPKKTKPRTLLNFNPSRPYTHPLLKNQSAVRLLSDVHVEEAALAKVFNAARQTPSDMNKRHSSAEQREQMASNINTPLSAEQRVQATSNVNKHSSSVEQKEQTALNINKPSSAEQREQATLNVNKHSSSVEQREHPPGEESHSYSSLSVDGVGKHDESFTTESATSGLSFVNSSRETDETLTAPSGDESVNYSKAAEHTSSQDAEETLEPTASERETLRNQMNIVRSPSAVDVCDQEQDGRTNLEPAVSYQEERISRAGSMSSIASDDLEFLNRVDNTCTSRITPQTSPAEKTTVLGMTKPSDGGGRSQAKENEAGAVLSLKSGPSSDVQVSQSEGEHNRKQREPTSIGEKVKTGYGKFMLDHQKVRNEGGRVDSEKSRDQAVGAESEESRVETKNVQEKANSERDDRVAAKTLQEKAGSGQEKHRVTTIKQKKASYDKEKDRIATSTEREKASSEREKERDATGREPEKASSEREKDRDATSTEPEKASSEREKERDATGTEPEKAGSQREKDRDATSSELEKRRIEQLETVMRDRANTSARHLEKVQAQHQKAYKDYELSKDNFASIDKRQKNARSYGERSRLEDLANCAFCRERRAAEHFQYTKVNLDRAVTDHKKAKEDLEQLLERSAKNIARNKEKGLSSAEGKDLIDKSAANSENDAEKMKSVAGKSTTQTESFVEKSAAELKDDAKTLGNQPEVLQHVIKISPNKIVLKKTQGPQRELKGPTEKPKDLSAGASVTLAKDAATSSRSSSDPSVYATKVVTGTSGTDSNPSVPEIKEARVSPTTAERVASSSVINETSLESAQSDSAAQGDHEVSGKEDAKEANQDQRRMEKTANDHMEGDRFFESAGDDIKTSDVETHDSESRRVGLPKTADKALDEYLDGLEDVSDVEEDVTGKKCVELETLDSYLDDLEDVSLGSEEEVAKADDDDDGEDEGDDGDGEKEESAVDERERDEDSGGIVDEGGSVAAKESGAEEENKDDDDDDDDDKDDDLTEGDRRQPADNKDSTKEADGEGLEDISDEELEFSQKSGLVTSMMASSPKAKTAGYMVLDEVSDTELVSGEVEREINIESAKCGKRLKKAKKRRKGERTGKGEKGTLKNKDDEVLKKKASVKERLDLSALSTSRSFDEADDSIMPSDTSDASDLESDPGYAPTSPQFPRGFDLRLVLNSRRKEGYVSPDEAIETEALSRSHGSSASREGSHFSLRDDCPDLKITCDLDDEELNLTISDSDPDSESSEEGKVDDELKSRQHQNSKEQSVKESAQDGKRFTQCQKKSAQGGHKSTLGGKRSTQDSKSKTVAKRKAKDLTREEKEEKLKRSLAEIDAKLEETRKKRKISKTDEESERSKTKLSRRESFENEPGIFHQPKRPRSPYSRSRRPSLSRQSPARSLATHSINKAKSYQTRAPKVSGSYNYDCKTGRWYWDRDSGFLPKPSDSGERQESDSEEEEEMEVTAIKKNVKNLQCLEMVSPDDSPQSPDDGTESSEDVTERPQSPEPDPRTDAASLTMKIPSRRKETSDAQGMVRPVIQGLDAPKSPDADMPESPDVGECPVETGPVNPKLIPSSPIAARPTSPVRARPNLSVRSSAAVGAKLKLPMGQGASQLVALPEAMGSQNPKNLPACAKTSSPAVVESLVGTVDNLEEEIHLPTVPLNDTESKASDTLGLGPGQSKRRKRRRRKNWGPDSPVKTFTVAKAVLALREGTFTESIPDSKLKFSETARNESGGGDKSNRNSSKTNIARSMRLDDATARQPSPSRPGEKGLKSNSSKVDVEICQRKMSPIAKGVSDTKRTVSEGKTSSPNIERRGRSYERREDRSAENSRASRRDVSSRHLSGSPRPKSRQRELCLGPTRSDSKLDARCSRSGTSSASPSSGSDVKLRHPALSDTRSKYDLSRSSRSRVDSQNDRMRDRRERLDPTDGCERGTSRSRSRVYRPGFYRHQRAKSPITSRTEGNRERTPQPRKRKVSDLELKPSSSGRILRAAEKSSSSERSGRSPGKREAAGRVDESRGTTAPLQGSGGTASEPKELVDAGRSPSAAEGSRPKQHTMSGNKSLSRTDSFRASAEKSTSADNVSVLAAYVNKEKWKTSPQKNQESRSIAEAYEMKNKQLQVAKKQEAKIYSVLRCYGLGKVSSHQLGSSKNCPNCCAKRRELGLKTVCPIPVKRADKTSGAVPRNLTFTEDIKMPVFGQKMAAGTSATIDNIAGALISDVKTKGSEQVSSASANATKVGDFGIVDELVKSYGESEKTGEKMNDILTNILEGMTKTGTGNSRAVQNLTENAQVENVGNSAEGAPGESQGASNDQRKTRSNAKNLPSFWKL